MRAAVVTVGTSHRESLGAMKCANWLRRTGWAVTETTDVGMFDRFDLFAFSCVFSWHLPRLVQMVRDAKAQGSEVWVGGPAVTFHHRNAEYVRRETGVEPHVGLDQRFEREPGGYYGVYFSRGCPAYSPACGTCPVPVIEGKAFSYYPDAEPAALLMDNNLSALPADYQDYIIRRYADRWRGGKVDANSGFEPHTFTVETLDRWERFPLMYWRFGYDDLSERDQALAMMKLLRDRGHGGRKVAVYCLIGNEPKDDCLRRVLEIIDHGCEPRPQALKPLDWHGGRLPVRHDWDEPTLKAFQRFYVQPSLWRTVNPDDYHYQSRYPLRGLRPSRRVSLGVTK